jgi:hypothetical protein
MPRSHAIWVVVSELYLWPMAAFTVKHELAEYLSQRTETEMECLHVWRCDNPMVNSGGRVYPRWDAPKPVEIRITDVLST